MFYPCHFYCMRLSNTDNTYEILPRKSLQGKKTITWHVDKRAFDWNWPNSAIIWYSAWFYSQMSWISWRQFHTRFLQSSTIIFLPYFTNTFWNNQESNHDLLYILFNNNARFSKADKTSKLWLKIFKFQKIKKWNKT